jgi:hypothetical protein
MDGGNTPMTHAINAMGATDADVTEVSLRSISAGLIWVLVHRIRIVTGQVALTHCRQMRTIPVKRDRMLSKVTRTSSNSLRDALLTHQTVAAGMSASRQLCKNANAFDFDRPCHRRYSAIG